MSADSESKVGQDIRDTPNPCLLGVTSPQLFFSLLLWIFEFPSPLLQLFGLCPLGLHRGPQLRHLVLHGHDRFLFKIEGRQTFRLVRCHTPQLHLLDQGIGDQQEQRSRADGEQRSRVLHGDGQQGYLCRCDWGEWLWLSEPLGVPAASV